MDLRCELLAQVSQFANALKARWHVIATGHYPMLSTPDELTKFILMT